MPRAAARRLIGASIAAGVIATGAIPVQTASADVSPSGFKKCKGQGAFWYAVRVQGTTCPKGKRLADAWVGAAAGDDGSVDDDVRVKGYRCLFDWDTARVRCKDGRKVVKFRAAF